MTPPQGVRQRQLAVIELLVWERESPKLFFQRSVKVCGDAATGCSTVKKWVCRVKGNQDDSTLSNLNDWQRSSSQRSTGKIMATVFNDIEGVILIDFKFRGTTINTDAYFETLGKLKARVKRVRPNLDMSKLLLQNNHARPHTSLKTREAIASFGWATITHPPHSPDVEPFDYHFFGPLKEGGRGQRFTNDEQAKQALRSWLKTQPAEFYKTGIDSLICRWLVELEKRGDYIVKWFWAPYFLTDIRT